MRFATLALLAFIIVGCSNSSHSDPIIDAVNLKVRSSLKDPDSAKIEILEVFPLFDRKIACGTVNAKNGFGGYTGAMSFSVPINPDGTTGNVNIADNKSLSAMNMESCKFLRAYGQRPGYSGSEPTPAQAAALAADHQKWAIETASKVGGKKR